jgi:hypothetical protein
LLVFILSGNCPANSAAGFSKQNNAAAVRSCQ